MKKILIICGPTASGKTELSLECAKLLNTEVISADSMNIYKGLNIGTAKPTVEEMSNVRHHLIDVVDAKSSFSVGDYKEMARPIVDKLLSENKIPVICGGTGFYINSILYDLSYGNGSGNLILREKYKKLAEEKGNEYIYNILKEKDYEASTKVHFNDIKRVIRALEILENGVKKSQLNDSFTPVYDYVAYSYNMDREELYSRINIRVDLMIKNGLVEEVDGLIKEGITDKNQCMQGIGYKEIYSYLTGKLTLDEAVEQIKLNTRHYAKRQITFFKKLPNLHLIKRGDVHKTAKGIIDNL